MIVLTAGEPPAIPASDAGKAQMPLLQAEWSRMHDEMARLSTLGSHHTVPGATRYIYKDRPEAVIGAISEVVNTYRPSSR